MTGDTQMGIIEATSERQRSNRDDGDVKQGLGLEYADKRRRGQRRALSTEY